MAKRKRVSPTKAEHSGGFFFPAEKGGAKFISSGCTVLDCVLGGGWPLGRIANIVGDKAVGKTLLAIEACANFHHIYPKGHIWYREAEAAFDEFYAAQLGLPVEQVDFGAEGIDTIWDTIEDIQEDLEKCLKQAEKDKQPGLYIIDSLDALTSRAELARKVGDGTFGLEKPKQLGQLFRKMTRRLKKAKVSFIVVSQIRDKIGVMFGDRYTRTGGKALDFYASQILWLHQAGQIKKTIKGTKRTVGVHVKAKCKKNKIAASFRDCDFILKFGYGVDDIEASVSWLEDEGMLDRIGLEEKGVSKYLKESAAMTSEEARTRRMDLARTVCVGWQEVEARFESPQKKYG